LHLHPVTGLTPDMLFRDKLTSNTQKARRPTGAVSADTGAVLTGSDGRLW